MTRTFLALATLIAAAGVASAQTTSPSTGSTTPPSSGSGATTLPGGASGGAGAMTSSDIKSKIEASGYKDVTGIKQDSSGNWTAMATKGTKQVAVSVDSKGMVKEAQQ
jgi:hypothetical protein